MHQHSLRWPFTIMAAMLLFSSAAALAGSPPKVNAPPLYEQPTNTCGTEAYFVNFEGGLPLYMENSNPTGDTFNIWVNFFADKDINDLAVFKFSGLVFDIVGTNNGTRNSQSQYQYFGPFLTMTDYTKSKTTLVPLSQGKLVKDLSNGGKRLQFTPAMLGFTSGDDCSMQIFTGWGPGYGYLDNVTASGFNSHKILKILDCKQ